MHDIENGFKEGIKTCLKHILTFKGLPLNSITKSIINKITQEEFDFVSSTMRNKGFPENIKKIIDTKSKKDAEIIARSSVILGDELAVMAYNADLIGFTHFRKHKWFYPDDVLHTEEENIAFSKNAKVGEVTDRKTKKFVTKLFEQIKKRKYISAHLLEKDDEWHVFYFDSNDMYLPKGINHYKDGPHVHYISHVFGGDLNKDSIWLKFDNRKMQINSIHIRYKETK